jgi:3-hydroxypropanoate dehydrogenase
MSHAVSDEALDTLFRAARTQNKWSDTPVSDAMLMAIYDLMRWAPTAANSSPARFLFLTSMEAKLRLKPLLSRGNREKSMAAPAIAIIGYDLDFPEKMPRLFVRDLSIKDYYKDKPEETRIDALRNGTLQGAYFIIAARALGLDCGPMGGFDREGVDKEFFAGSKIKSNFLCALGHGDPEGIRPRDIRLSFDEACRII